MEIEAIGWPMADKYTTNLRLVEALEDNKKLFTIQPMTCQMMELFRFSEQHLDFLWTSNHIMQIIIIVVNNFYYCSVGNSPQNESVNEW